MFYIDIEYSLVPHCDIWAQIKSHKHQCKWKFPDDIENETLTRKIRETRNEKREKRRKKTENRTNISRIVNWILSHSNFPLSDYATLSCICIIIIGTNEPELYQFGVPIKKKIYVAMYHIFSLFTSVAINKYILTTCIDRRQEWTVFVVFLHSSIGRMSVPGLVCRIVTV